jgi:hypothetical protein
VSVHISLDDFFHKIFSNSSALISHVQGLLTQIFSFVNISHFLISLIVTTVAKANFIQGSSSFTGHLIHHLHFAIILLHSINSFKAFLSIEQIISGHILSIISVKCLSSIEAHKATAHKHE